LFLLTLYDESTAAVKLMAAVWFVLIMVERELMFQHRWSGEGSSI
jgi:hypothetical protein